MPTLSKSALLAALQCRRRAWLNAEEPREPFSEVARLKRKNSETLKASYIANKGSDAFTPTAEAWETRVEETMSALVDGAQVLHGACLEAAGVRVRVDHLHQTKAGWEATEVRGAGAIKPTHTSHTGVIAFVLQELGMAPAALRLAHINTNWNGTSNTDRFVEVDVTEAALQRASELGEALSSLKTDLAGTLPDAQTGPHCKRPVVCRFFDRCHPPSRAHGLDELYRVKAKILSRLKSNGITRIADIPDNVPLPEIAGRQRLAVMTNAVVVSPGLASALEAIQTPAIYIDFEAIQPALPPWPDCRPFGIVPVQVSMHRVEHDGTMVHTEWIAEPGIDPRPALARLLADTIGDARTLIAYHATFEQNVLNHLASHTDQDSAEVLLSARERFVDLLPMVRNHVYHPSFHGRFNLKVVVEALLPKFSYGDLQVRRGDEASLMLQDLLLYSQNDDPVAQDLRQRDLLAYCERDTLVMVHLERLLRELAQQSA